MKVLICGLDTASNRWHAMVRLHTSDPPTWTPSQCKTTGGPDQRRVVMCKEFDAMLSGLASLGAIYDARIHVFCEEPLALQNGKTTRLLGLAAGALWDRALPYDLFWHWVDVSSWQSMVGVSSRDSKEQRKAKAKAFMVEQMGVPEDLDEDHYDAGCCAEYGYRELQKLPEAWQE